MKRFLVVTVLDGQITKRVGFDREIDATREILRLVDVMRANNAHYALTTVCSLQLWDQAKSFADQCRFSFFVGNGVTVIGVDRRRKHPTGAPTPCRRSSDERSRGR